MLFRSESTITLKLNNESQEFNYRGTRYIDDEDLKYEFKNTNMLSKIEQIATPMFLDLNRRFVKNTRIEDFDKNDRFMYHSIKRKETIDYDLSLEEVKELVKKSINTITRIEVKRLEKLKKDFILESFKIQIVSVENISNLPELETIKKYKEKISETLRKLQLIDDNSVIEDFFNTIEKNLTDIILLHNDKNKNKNKNSKDITNAITSWIVNQPQLQKIINLSELIDNHQSSIKKLHQNKDNFQNAVNKFFEETQKKLIIKENGDIEIEIKGKNRNINFLASGERQILIMLCHLYLNKELPKNGIFIIDEPELSLHLLWQEKFVDEIIKAKPDLQIILATHSPAIIQNRDDKYIPLNNFNK